jgi:hypothetical protein
MIWGKLSLTDLDPRHLSAKPFACIALGSAAFCIAGWFVAMFGGWLWWVVALAGLALIGLGGYAAVKEKRALEATEPEEHA